MRVGVVTTASAAQPCGQLVARAEEPVGRQRHRGGSLLKRSQVSVASAPYRVIQRCDEPGGMRVHDGEVLDDGSLVDRARARAPRSRASRRSTALANPAALLSRAALTSFTLSLTTALAGTRSR